MDREDLASGVLHRIDTRCSQLTEALLSCISSCTCSSSTTLTHESHITMSQLGERTLSEIKDLVNTHLPEIIQFINTECKTVHPVSAICIIRSFCEIIHYHFFLGQEVSRLQKFAPLEDLHIGPVYVLSPLTRNSHAQTAPRRTVAFVRVVFVFAVIWSFGALLHPDSRAAFDSWLRQRVENARLVKFPYIAGDDYTPSLWVIYVIHVISEEYTSYALK